MNIERAALRGRLEEARGLAAKLKLRIEGNCIAIRQGLNTVLSPVEELAIPVIAEQMDELVAAWGELQAVKLQIARFEKELA